MKKLFALMAAAGFALTLGVAFADEKPIMSDRSGGLYNGITYFDVGQSCELAESEAGGSAAGGMSTEEPVAVVDNGITSFAPVAITGQCALHPAEEGLSVDNGITYFGPRAKGM